jgi:hypothetical protein
MRRQTGPLGITKLADGTTLELRAGDNPALVLIQSEIRVQVEFAHVKGEVAASADAAADPAELLAADGVYGA